MYTCGELNNIGDEGNTVSKTNEEKLPFWEEETSQPPQQRTVVAPPSGPLSHSQGEVATIE